MRSLRRAALAGATAATLLLGSTTVAFADEAPAATATKTSNDSVSAKAKASSSESKDKKQSDAKADKKIDKDTDSDEFYNKLRTTSTRLGDKLQADRPANGDRLWGSTKAAEHEPLWARYMKVVTIVSVVGSLLGLVVFPAYNFLVANRIIVK